MKEHDCVKYTYEDYEQIALIALHKACKSYKDDCGAKFSTFATNVIKQQLYHYTKPLKSIKHSMGYLNIPLHSQIKKADGELRYDEIIQTEYEYYETNVDRLINKEDAEYVKLFMTTLSEKDNSIINMYVKGMNHTEIAQELGCTRQNVSASFKKITKNFKNMFE